jgi:drug/metabolite transporter (DMT)-like permease
MGRASSRRRLLDGCVLWRAAGRRALPTAREWRNALVIGTLMLGGGMGLGGPSAIRHIGSACSRLHRRGCPILTCGWGLLFGQKPHRLEAGGMVVGVAGVLWLVRGASFCGRAGGLACIAGATLPGRSAPCSPRRSCRWPPGPEASQRNVVWRRGVDARFSRVG